MSRNPNTQEGSRSRLRPWAALAIACFGLSLLPGSAAAANSYFKNVAVAEVAERRPELSVGGQCMRFVHDVLWEVSGHRISTSAYAYGYQGTFKAKGGSLVSDPAAAIKGDVIQITPAGTSDSWTGTPFRLPLHTAIVRRNLGGGNFAVIDSNFHFPEDERVRRHTLNPYTFARRYGGGIVKIWRMGSVPATSPAPIGPSTSPAPPTSPTTAPTAPTPTATVPDRLSNGGTLVASKNQYIRSADGRYRFVMQQDGNLVLYGPSGPLWASNTVGRGATRAVMQGDGNLVLYTSTGKPVWASNTELHYHAYLVVQNDGNVVIYEGSKPLWATGTDGRT
jgi:hypothetical protein